LLSKFEGKNFTDEPGLNTKKRYRIIKLPRYLIVHVKRFFKNEFFMEKNPTIVNFPIKNLDLTELVWQKESAEKEQTKKQYKYDLIANVIHEGKAESGTYRVQVLHKPTDEWFDI
jgi:U4/U6.U5 tri-snRNP-associated protein 2